MLCLDAKVTLDGNAGFRHPDHEAWEDKSAVDPLEQAAKAKDLNYVKLDGEVGIIGNGAGLVMSTLDVVAYAGEEFGGVKPANFLDIGGGASAEVMANGLEIVLSDPSVRSVFVNVFGGITACDAVANGILSALDLLKGAGRGGHQAARGPAGRQQRRGGPAHPGLRRPTRSWSGWTQWMVPRGARPSWRRQGSDDMAIWLTKDSKVIVQGMTGSEGSKHTRRMLRAGTNIVGGVTPGKGGQKVDFDGTSVPVFGSVAEAMAETGADASVVFVPPKFAKGGRDRGGRRRHPAGRGHHRGHPGARHGRVLGPQRRAGQADPHHRAELPRHRQPGAVQRRHHPGRHHRGRPHRPGLEVGHADLPDDVRAARHRLLDRRSASAATR